MNQKLCVVLLVCTACRPDAPPQPSERPPEVRALQEAVLPELPSAPATPEGMVRIPSGPGPAGMILRPAIRYAFFIDKLETTVAEYQACVDAGVCTPAWDGEGSYERFCTVGKAPNLPISCVSIDQARAYCAWRGKRLLVDIEWHWAARGEQRPRPWGDAPIDCEHANTSLGKFPRLGCLPEGGPWPVGSAPKGATPDGVLDMLGNLAEWVEEGASISGYTRFGGLGAGSSWYRDNFREDTLWHPFGGGSGEGTPTDQMGIRCGADAVIKPAPPPRMAFLHDGGTAFVREQPVAIDAPFFLDTFEATVEEYSECVDSGACTSANASTGEQECTADTDGPAKRPINCITHAQAAAFCEARGSRLPTAAEWQWAMQNQEQQSNYPWGDDGPWQNGRPGRCTVANVVGDPLGCGFDGPWPVVQGSFGDTFEGVHDMIGNVGEWTSSTGDTAEHRLHAGRGWKAAREDLQHRIIAVKVHPNVGRSVKDRMEAGRPSTIIASAPAKSWSDQIGVRCARDAPKAIE